MDQWWMNDQDIVICAVLIGSALIINGMIALINIAQSKGHKVSYWIFMVLNMPFWIFNKIIRKKKR